MALNKEFYLIYSHQIGNRYISLAQKPRNPRWSGIMRSFTCFEIKRGKQALREARIKISLTFVYIKSDDEVLTLLIAEDVNLLRKIFLGRNE